MGGILDWGIDSIVGLRELLPGMEGFFANVTFLGDELFFLIFIPLTFWCLDRLVGARLIVVFLVSSWLNSCAKELGQQPRPCDYDSGTLADVPACADDPYDTTGFGLPSGHTQNTVVIWSYLASQFRNKWFWVLAALLIILIPLSRVYLGVHFPTDLLGGYLMGVAVLLLYFWLEPRAEAALERIGLVWQLAISILVPAVLLLVLPAETAVSSASTLMGMGAGFALERRWVGFETAGAWWKRALRYVVGMAVMFGLYMGLSAAFEGLEPALFFRFIRYGLVGLWGGLGAPWAFTKLRLAGTRSSAEPAIG
jgi:membrane-associated phospholipid phosphatase